MAEMNGGSFTLVTVTVKLRAAIAPTTSHASTVTSVWPIWFVAGKIASVRLVPLPPKVILAEGNRNGLSAIARRRSMSAGVRSSLTLKGTTSELSSLIV